MHVVYPYLCLDVSKNLRVIDTNGRLHDFAEKL